MPLLTSLLETKSNGAAPVTVQRTSGNLSLVGDQAGTWVDVDPGGDAEGRPLDLVIPCAPGQTVEAYVRLYSPSAAGGFYMALTSIVSGSPVTVIDGTFGTQDLWLWNSTLTDVQAVVTYTATAADIEDGHIRLRLQRKWTSQAGTRTINASSASANPLRMVGRGPFG